MGPYVLWLRWQQAGHKDTPHAYLYPTIWGEHTGNCARVGHCQDSLCLLILYLDNSYTFDAFFLTKFYWQNNVPNQTDARGLLKVQGRMLKPWFAPNWVCSLKLLYFPSGNNGIISIDYSLSHTIDKKSTHEISLYSYSHVNFSCLKIHASILLLLHPHVKKVISNKGKGMFCLRSGIIFVNSTK